MWFSRCEGILPGKRKDEVYYGRVDIMIIGKMLVEFVPLSIT